MFNPFTLLGLEKKFQLDLKDLEQAYFEAQKKAHPDQFAQASLEEKRQAIELSTKINQAYLVLKSPLNRAEYLLEAAGFKPLAQDLVFLTEVLEWRERQENGENISPYLREEEERLLKALHTAFEEKKYSLIQNIIYRLKYIQKILKENK